MSCITQCKQLVAVKFSSDGNLILEGNLLAPKTVKCHSLRTTHESSLGFNNENCTSGQNLSLIPSFSLPDVLCDPTDLIWRKGTSFEAMTGRMAPSSDGLLAEVFWGFPRL